MKPLDGSSQLWCQVKNCSKLRHEDKSLFYEIVNKKLCYKIFKCDFKWTLNLYWTSVARGGILAQYKDSPGRRQQQPAFLRYDSFWSNQLLNGEILRGPLRPRPTIGPNGKNPPKNFVKKIGKLTDYYYSCNILTNFEYEVHLFTGNRNAGSCFKKNLSNHITNKWTIFMADFRQLKPLCSLGLPPGSLWHPPKDKGLFPTFGWTSKWVNWESTVYFCWLRS